MQLKENPFFKAKKLHASWIKNVAHDVNVAIDRISEEIKMEAEYDGQPELADEEFLYKCFKNNSKYGMYYGNLQVLKYYIKIFQIKILYEIIGKNKFTKKDEEIYNYFKNTKYNKLPMLLYKKLKFNSCAEYNYSHLLFNDTARKNFIIYDVYKDIKNSQDKVFNMPYYFYFGNLFIALENMIRNVKGLDPFSDLDLFKMKNRYQNIDFTPDKNLVYINSHI
jgi:hypothetical protein